MFDNLASSGLASAIFSPFIGIDQYSFSMVQYALLSSLMTLTPKILGGYSGAMVNRHGYPVFSPLPHWLGFLLLFVDLYGR